MFAQMRAQGALRPCKGCDLYELRLPETGEYVRELHPLAVLAINVGEWLDGGPTGAERYRATPIPLNPFELHVVLHCMDVRAQVRAEYRAEMEEKAQREAMRKR